MNVTHSMVHRCVGCHAAMMDQTESFSSAHTTVTMHVIMHVLCARMETCAAA